MNLSIKIEAHAVGLSARYAHADCCSQALTSVSRGHFRVVANSYLNDCFLS